jgi:2-amino-4-hydroxy-6-hydroxymethyldihydropteridine diphosphokinase
MKAGLGLGSNQGDRLQQLRLARQFLAGVSEGGWLLVSPLFETVPVDCPAGSALFLNAVLEIEFGGTPAELLARTQAQERAQGRARQAVRNAPRPIDLDILYFGSCQLAEPGLVIPHPRLAQRRFVLAPLATIRPELQLPGWNQTVAALLAALPPGADEVRLWRTEW